MNTLILQYSNEFKIIDYITSLLLSIERFSEVFGLGLWRFGPPMLLGKAPKLERLEQVKVITRFL